TGTTPLDRQHLRSATLTEVLRRIREEEPIKPSARLSSSEALPALSAQRRAEPKKLGKMVRGDLDWMVMKALAKDRTRRYATANGCAQDIQGYRAGEPVAAGPPSTAYRLRKLIVRHRVKVVVAALLLLVLVTGIVGTTWGLVWAVEEKQQTAAALQ